MSAQQLADVLERIKALEAENARLRTNKGNSHGIKISAKGAVSVYGLGRFPLTLYASQWVKLLTEKGPEIMTFIQENQDKLAEKPVKPVEQKAA
jgi:hypothetical protein